MHCQSASKSACWVLECLKYVSCVFFGKFCRSRFAPIKTGMIVPSFKNAVNHIIRLCSNPKMIWPDACSHIAAMQNVKPFWYRSTMQNPRRNVCSNWFSSMSRAVNLSVPKFMFPSRPKPASICFYNLLPKPLRKRWGQSLTRQIFGSNFDSHSKPYLLCHALGCFSNAGASSFNGRILSSGGQL